METLPLYGLFTGSLRGLFLMESNNFLRVFYGDSFRWHYGDFSSLRRFQGSFIFLFVPSPSSFGIPGKLYFSFVSKPMEYARLAEKNGTLSPNAPKGKLDGKLYRKIYGKVSSSRKDCHEKPCSNKCTPGCCTEVNSVPAE